MAKENTELHDYLLSNNFYSKIRGYYSLGGELAVSISNPNSGTLMVCVNHDWRNAFEGSHREVINYLKGIL